MTNEVVFAGFGGQGVLLAGKLLAYAGMIDGKEVSWIPAYGPEMRGGTASCSVIISESAIGSPLVTAPSILVAMNKPSLNKFEPKVKVGGTIIVNSSLIDQKVERKDVSAYYVPLNEIALKLGNDKFTNMVALGALLGAADMVQLDSLQKTFVKNFTKKPEMVGANIEAVQYGRQVVLDAKQNQ